MDTVGLLRDLFGRIPSLVEDTIAGLDADDLTRAPAPGLNTIGWLIWHLTRVQDHYVAGFLDAEQLWGSDQTWAARFGLEPDPSNTGYGHRPEEVTSVRPAGPDALLAYLDAVDQRTRTMLETLTPADLDRIVDPHWDPPVTMGVRLISVADDSLQHIGQAAYLRGWLEL
jgi:uncharacterized damage-inducible protein DinB